MPGTEEELRTGSNLPEQRHEKAKEQKKSLCSKVLSGNKLGLCEEWQCGQCGRVEEVVLCGQSSHLQEVGSMILIVGY